MQEQTDKKRQKKSVGRKKNTPKNLPSAVTKSVRQAVQESIASQTFHIVHREAKWRLGSRREVLSGKGVEFDRQRDAVAKAREIVRKRGGEIVVHGRKGVILFCDTYVTQKKVPFTLVPDRFDRTK